MTLTSVLVPLTRSATTGQKSTNPELTGRFWRPRTEAQPGFLQSARLTLWPAGNGVHTLTSVG